MIHIFYLAAGQSRRYGSNKLLEPFGELPLYRHGLETIREAVRGYAVEGGCRLYVVTCWREIESALEGEPDIRLVWSSDSPLGMSYTIKAAIAAALPIAEGDYMVFAVADQPYLSPSSVRQLLDTAALSPTTACLSCGERSGNPVLFSAALAPELLELDGDCGGKRVMLRHPEGHIDVQCSPHELSDIDYRIGSAAVG